MAVSYNRLWKLLIEKNISQSEMRKMTDIAPNTLTRMRKDEEVSLPILDCVCKLLDCDFGDSVEYIADDTLFNSTKEV